MSELKVAVMTATSQNLVAVGGKKRAVRWAGFIAANLIMPITRNPAG